MKRNVVSAIAVLSLVTMFVTPAAADLSNSYSVPGNTVLLPGQGGRSDNLPVNFGIVNSAGTAVLPPTAKILANSSSNISITWGFSWVYSDPYATFPGPSGVGGGRWAILGTRFNILWDSGELSPTAVPLNVAPGGGAAGLTMLPLNYSPITLGSFLVGLDATATTMSPIINVGLLANRGGGTTFGKTGTTMTTMGATNSSGGFGMSIVGHNQLVKVGKATFHVDPGAHPNDGLDLFFTGGISGRFFTDITSPTTFGGTIMTRIWTNAILPGSIFIFGATPGGYDVIPEPASASLLGVGLLALVGGAWRRRKRRHA